MGAPAQIEETVRAYFQCLDDENWSRMRGLWHPQGEMLAVGARPRAGLEDVMSLLEKLFVPWRRHRDRPDRVIVSGNTVTVEVVFTGTTRDGREASFDAVDVFDFEDGLIRRLTNWYDIDRARRAVADKGAAG